jgi:glucose/arabinose dehydrogenase
MHEVYHIFEYLRLMRPPLAAYLLFLAFVLIAQNHFVYVQIDEKDLASGKMSPITNFAPKIIDQNLEIEVVAKGLEFPTTMAFLGPDDILVLEKNQGTVKRVINGQILDEPVLDVNVATNSERGMLGIAVTEKENENKPIYVFLYFTETEKEGREDPSSEQKAPLGNRLYRYELVNDKLVNPWLLLDLPVTERAVHNGGIISVGPDNNIYLLAGSGAEDKREHPESNDTKAFNIGLGLDPDGRGGILRVTQDGEIVNGKGILGDEHPLDMYYAYGIRNGFGMDFDPVTGNLWDTENGPRFGDEINLVEPGFNSGWKQVNGFASDDEEFDPSNLVNFRGNGKYSEPEFSWSASVAPTALKFLPSNKLGAQYQNDLFVSDFNHGNVYHFELDGDRRQLSIVGPLEDKNADNIEELREVIFGQDFGGITDIKVGPDGYLYILSLYRGGDDCKGPGDEDCIPYSSGAEGTIFRISPQ